MNSIVRNIFAIFAACIALAVSSCSDDDFVMNSSFLSSNTYAVYTDQTPIELATFRLDSVETSGKGIVWVGTANKPVIGNIHSESYVKLSEPTYAWVTKEKYDSITIVLRHTGDYQGDTTKSITIEIEQLDQPIRFAENESSFYNVRTFRTRKSIGKHTYTPRPNSHPRVRFRLDDDFGQELVDLVKANNSLASDQATTAFENFLGGIKITYDGEPSSLQAYIADSVHIVLHSHIPLMEKSRIQRRLEITETEKQYNYVWSDGADEPYNSIANRYSQVTESEGGLHSVMYEGLGYYTRVNFPTLEVWMTENLYSHIVKAQLKIYPERDSYDKHYFPDTFYLTEINKGNVLGNVVYNSSGYAVYSTLYNNILDENDVYYLVDITYYINTILSQEYIESGAGLVLTWGSEMDPTNYHFMLMNGNGTVKYHSELQIYYYNYDKEER